MAASPRFKVINPMGEYVSSCKYAEDAAMLVSNWGEGSKIRDGGRVVWHEGREEFAAGESFDGVARIIFDRIAAYGEQPA